MTSSFKSFQCSVFTILPIAQYELIILRFVIVVSVGLPIISDVINVQIEFPAKWKNPNNGIHLHKTTTFTVHIHRWLSSFCITRKKKKENVRTLDRFHFSKRTILMYRFSLLKLVIFGKKNKMKQNFKQKSHSYNRRHFVERAKQTQLFMAYIVRL